MGAGCSRPVVVLSHSRIDRASKTSDSSPQSTTVTSTTGSAIKSLASAAIWSPFHLSRTEAEELLRHAEPGSYIFSHDPTSELFISMSVGTYVCHHAVVTRGHGYYVGAKRFSTISDVITYFKDHPLGETKLKNEYKSTKCTPHVQVKQHADVTFQTPAPISGGHAPATWSPQENSTQVTQLAPSLVVSDASQHDVTNEEDARAVLAGNSAAHPPSSLHSSKAPTLLRKALRREMAVERSDSSGEYRDVPSSISPLLINDFPRA